MNAGEEHSGLAGVEVAITGRLASMTRDEAVRRLEAAGARYVPGPGPTTRFLFVGQGGPALGDDGRPTHSLRAARDLQEQGSGIRVVPEEELLAHLGVEGFHPGRLYTAEQLGRILDVPLAHIRSWVRHGLIQPLEVVHRLCFFDFRQVASARSLVQLTRAGVSPGRIRAGLERLGRWLDEPTRALAQLEVLERSDTLCVRTAEGRLAEPSGQLRLFAEEAPAVSAGSVLSGVPATGAAPIGEPAADDPPTDWFDRGQRAEEEERLDAAAEAYARALEEGDERPEVAFNLGNVLYSQGRAAEAAEVFSRVTETCPEFVEAWNNLGNALHDAKHRSEAVQAYQRALAIAPDYADAHYNLADTLVALGDLAQACRHWRAYLRQDPASPTADEVRACLRAIREG